MRQRLTYISKSIRELKKNKTATWSTVITAIQRMCGNRRTAERSCRRQNTRADVSELKMKFAKKFTPTHTSGATLCARHDLRQQFECILVCSGIFCTQKKGSNAKIWLVLPQFFRLSVWERRTKLFLLSWCKVVRHMSRDAMSKISDEENTLRKKYGGTFVRDA